MGYVHQKENDLMYVAFALQLPYEFTCSLRHVIGYARWGRRGWISIICLEIHYVG
jgi:hypothetical protein